MAFAEYGKVCAQCDLLAPWHASAPPAWPHARWALLSPWTPRQASACLNRE